MLKEAHDDVLSLRFLLYVYKRRVTFLKVIKMNGSTELNGTEISFVELNEVVQNIRFRLIHFTEAGNELSRMNKSCYRRIQ
jgi:hypothetical protein